MLNSSADSKRLNVGQLAPDVEVVDINDEPVRLADLWRHGPVLLTFLRHFG